MAAEGSNSQPLQKRLKKGSTQNDHHHPQRPVAARKSGRFDDMKRLPVNPRKIDQAAMPVMCLTCGTVSDWHSLKTKSVKSPYATDFRAVCPKCGDAGNFKQ